MVVAEGVRMAEIEKNPILRTDRSEFMTILLKRTENPWNAVQPPHLSRHV
jgi:hypothetical protein